MKKKILAAVLACALSVSLIACGQTDTTEPDGDTADQAATYTVGICQLVQHDALDAATRGFIDALNEALPGQVVFEEKNASGDSANCASQTVYPRRRPLCMAHRWRLYDGKILSTYH